VTETSDGLSPSAFVHEGLDGWLFLQGGSNYVASLYRRDVGNVSDRRLALWRKLIEARAARCRALGIECVHIVVPDKLTIYGDRLAAPLIDPEQSPALRLAEQMAQSPARESFIDLVAPMRARRNDFDIYWRTDTHWTPEGCHVAYEALCQRFGVAPEPDLLTRPRLETPRVLDLGGRVEPLRWETIRKYDFSLKARRLWANAITRYLEDPFYDEIVHVGARARFENPQARNPQSLLLFGDSYSRPGVEGLTAMLAETFAKLEFAWSNAIDWRLVKACKPNVVIFEIAERFLAILPNDRLPLWTVEARQALRAQRKLYQSQTAEAAKATGGKAGALTNLIRFAKGETPRLYREFVPAHIQRRASIYERQIEFDPTFYRDFYEDARGLSDRDLRRHFLTYGLPEGRLGSAYAMRDKFITLLDQNAAILEIGPFTNPSIRGPKVKYFDVLDDEALLDRAKTVGYTISDPPHIDYVSPEGDLSIVMAKFAAVFSSHSLEHQPDLICHLRQVEALLAVGGAYFVIVPDKRFCFDHPIAETTVDEIIHVHREGLARHRLQTVILHRALTTHNDPERHWNGDHFDPATVESIDARTIAAVEEFGAAEGRYLDVHAWRFTPCSFIEVVKTLCDLGLINLWPVKVFNTPRNKDEFCAILKRRR
jgi:alginate O-acetyltransferase complex protein AlgJ